MIKGAKSVPVILLLNAITEALREIEKCPDDSMQDIFNEKFKEWETGLRMNQSYVIESEL